MTDPIPTAKVDDADRERIAAGLLMLVDPADALEAAIARIAYLEERNDELQQDVARLTSDLGQARETISALTSSRARHLGERNDARAEVDRLAALLAAAEEGAEKQRRAACNLRDALDRVATAAGVADGSGDEVADRIVEAIGKLRESVARHKTAAGPAESVHAALGVSSREAARAAMEHGVPCPTCGAESSPPTGTPAPCAHLDRAHDGSCFDCGRGEDNPNPEDTP